MHTMKVQTKYYNLLKNGSKTIELRLYDEKRQLIQVGDTVQFSNLADPNDTFQATVVALHRASDFASLCQIIRPEQAGFKNQGELLQIMEQFYSPKKQQEYGVIGIEIKYKGI